LPKASGLSPECGRSNPLWLTTPFSATGANSRREATANRYHRRSAPVYGRGAGAVDHDCASPTGRRELRRDVRDSRPWLHLQGNRRNWGGTGQVRCCLRRRAVLEGLTPPDLSAQIPRHLRAPASGFFHTGSAGSVLCVVSCPPPPAGQWRHSHSGDPKQAAGSDSGANVALPPRLGRQSRPPAPLAKEQPDSPGPQRFSACSRRRAALGVR